MKLLNIFALLFYFVLTTANADENQALRLIPVTENIWAIVGPLTNRTKENLGNNATFGFVETKEGIVVIDPGGSLNGAKAIDSLIKSVSKKPVRYVINTGGQDHRWLGSDYFSQQGAKVIASEAANQDHRERFNTQWTALSNMIGDAGIQGTKAKYADISFKDNYRLTLGGVVFEIIHKGKAHTPGDAFVWLPQSKVMFTGDIVYTERMLGVGEESNSKSWLTVFDAMAAYQSQFLVPGHGSPTTLDAAIKDTRDYLVFLRDTVATFMEQGGGAHEISRINQTQFKYLNNYDTLHGRNALKVYTELEWE